ncbi:MAG: hypothetical protein LBO82_09300 [Synergistaceae bacterium]|nr:hypothetical protein [Synergistaceae bacterium]
MNMKYRRVAVLAVSFCVLAAFWTGAVFVLSHAEHDCAGEACPVCAQMKSASDALRCLLEELLKPAAPVYRALLPLFVLMFFSGFFNGIKRHTLISTKVRLND